MPAPDTPVEALKNIGPKSAQWLREIGMESYADLEKAGPVMKQVITGKILQHRFKGINLLMLYALYATTRDRHWQSLSADEKEMLKKAASEPLEIS